MEIAEAGPPINLGRPMKEFGLVSLMERLPTCARERSRQVMAGRPYAGNPLVRLDGSRQETGRKLLRQPAALLLNKGVR
jgi:hypothetical protein